MNGNQQSKALGYALSFLENEIESLKETLKTATDPFIKPHLERRLRELERDFDMFQEIKNNFI
ncbi:hypothetical protein BEP19_15975 [Ammoniphilus oxalaticus]|uniref:Uncharacterized protein n=1 Tax=Ammoniphilus oxalaticus TaxID=66863 RepID=A0A419SQE9_9BACL|nr:hypothetical protein [Ammoniphilus oxalaticus]RKD26702.1 hypothetical protein BEP19_15975 [Ammoniphilus oxalaticus]